MEKEDETIITNKLWFGCSTFPYNNDNYNNDNDNNNGIKGRAFHVVCVGCGQGSNFYQLFCLVGNLALLWILINFPCTGSVYRLSLGFPLPFNYHR